MTTSKAFTHQTSTQPCQLQGAMLIPITNPSFISTSTPTQLNWQSLYNPCMLANKIKRISLKLSLLLAAPAALSESHCAL